jgi:hypothetical protein
VAETITFLRQALRHIRLARALEHGLRAHRTMEHEFRERLLQVSGKSIPLEFPFQNSGAARYFECNIFSILFLSIFQSLGLSEARVRAYGLILHSLRGVVTSTDNILDRESKGALRIQGAQGWILPNVMLLLLQSGLLYEVLSELAHDPGLRHDLQRQIITALQEIATEEVAEEHEINEVLTPEDLLNRIHRYRGGQLLELAFIVPVMLETERAGDLRLASAAVHRIGLGLQILDDITDLDLDLQSRNHNILRSWIVHRGCDGPFSDDALRAHSSADLRCPWKTFPNATHAVLAQATDEARSGFAALGNLGFPIDREGIDDLLGWLFRARGLEDLWKLSNARI